MVQALYWSGGKDCTLALLNAKEHGIKVKYLITFVGEDVQFLCHPLPIIRQQGRALGLTHLFPIIRKPYLKHYYKEISRMKRRYDIESVITGDLISEEADSFQHYWLQRMCNSLGVHLSCPLGSCERKDILDLVIGKNLYAAISGINISMLSISLLWKRMNDDIINMLIAMGKQRSDFDICGENGEYHTSVFECNAFKIPKATIGTVLEIRHQMASFPIIV